MGDDFPDFDLLDNRITTSEPFIPPPMNPEGDAPTVPQQLIKGSRLTKVTNGKRKPQLFFLNVEGSRVSWSGKLRQKYFWIDDIRGFRTGRDALVNRQDHKDEKESDRWLTVLYADPERTKSTKSLSVVAPSRNELLLWVDTLEALSKHRADLMTSMRESGERESIIKAHWDSELGRQKPVLSSNAIDLGLQLGSIESLCRKLHIHSPKSILQEMFTVADVRMVGYLDYDQFKMFLRKLKERQDLRDIFNELRRPLEQGLTKAQFFLFLETCQGANMGLSRQYWEKEFNRCVKASTASKVTDGFFSDEGQPVMTYEAFCSFMLSQSCSVYHSLGSKPFFGRPLNEYFIASSHNTYLKGRQVVGESSTEAYVAALRHGCRCVEIDCWNGPEREPIVTHGHTRTSSILFSDCVAVIGRYAFDYSPYPLILSLEVHCDAEQQSRMVRHMIDFLGDKLLREPLHPDSTELPSPEELKHKILIKVKSNSASATSPREVDDVSGMRQRSVSTPSRSSTNSSALMLPPMPPIPTALTTSPPISLSDAINSPQEQSGTTTSVNSADEDSDGLEPPQFTGSTSTKKLKTTNITPELAKLGVYLQGFKFNNLQSPEAREPNHIFSLDESRANAICNDAETKALFEEHNVNFMSRVYPKGSRLDSSNFDPNTFWRRGVQMVALNWQTYDKYQQMNQAMFAAGTDAYGYVQKPAYMLKSRVKEGEMTVRRKVPRKDVKFSVEVISAQQLPRLPDMQKVGSINPFVEVQMFSADDRSRGLATGKGGENKSPNGNYAGIGSPYSRRTKIIPDNGYNPQFRSVFELSVETKYPELVFVRFVVWHSPDARYAGKNCKQLAVFTSKLDSLQPGYRHIPLYNGSGEEFIFSTLFCRITKSEPSLNANSFQESSDRLIGRTGNFIKNVLTRNLSGERARERSSSLEK